MRPLDKRIPPNPLLPRLPAQVTAGLCGVLHGRARRGEQGKAGRSGPTLTPEQRFVHGKLATDREALVELDGCLDLPAGLLPLLRRLFERIEVLEKQAAAKTCSAPCCADVPR
jgi:hypothetical protein